MRIVQTSLIVVFALLSVLGLCGVENVSAQCNCNQPNCPHRQPQQIQQMSGCELPMQDMQGSYQQGPAVYQPPRAYSYQSHQGTRTTSSNGCPHCPRFCLKHRFDKSCEALGLGFGYRENAPPIPEVVYPQAQCSLPFVFNRPLPMAPAQPMRTYTTRGPRDFFLNDNPSSIGP